MKKIKNLIFDFGGVLYNIDINYTIKEFKKIGINIKPSDLRFANALEKYESGLISDDDFSGFLSGLSEINATKKQVIDAFNTVLKGLNMESYHYLLKFHNKYNLYLFSNTSSGHYMKFHKEIINNPDTAEFYNCFIKEYYSFRLGMRKPEIRAFRYVIQDSGIDPSVTLFIDDNPENVEAAKTTGLNTFVYGKEGYWKELIKKFKLVI